MSGFNEWLERKYPEYLLEQGAVNPAGTPNSFTPISKGKEEFYKYDKDGKIPSVNSTLTPNNPTPKTSMGMDNSDAEYDPYQARYDAKLKSLSPQDRAKYIKNGRESYMRAVAISKEISKDPDFNNSYLQKQYKDYDERNKWLWSYISIKGGVDKLHNWEYEDLVHGIAQKMFDKSFFPPEAAEKVLKNRRDLDERNKRALEQYISYQEQPISSNQQQPMASNQQQPMASNRQQPMASNRNRVAQTNKPRTGLLKKIFRR
jgi:hypothetical protein